MDTYKMLLEILMLKHKPLEEITNKLCIHKGTLKRWLEKKKVPNNYYFDLNHLLNDKYSEEPEIYLDQYFTKSETAIYCFEKLKEIVDIKDYIIIEPSAGDCSFFNLLLKDKRIGIDLKPRHKEIIKMNYLDYQPPKGNYIVFGNPPFGLRGNTALRFINHSALFADYVAFILPPLFNSKGKGVAGTRVKDFKSIYCEKLPVNSFIYPNGKEVDVSTIFQIYSKKDQIDTLKLTCNTYIKIYSLSDGGTPSSTRNKKMLYKCDIYLPSTCFSGMKIYTSFDDLPLKRGYGIVILKDRERVLNLFNKIDLSKEAFLGTNSSLNLNFETIRNILIKNGFVD